MSDTNEENDSKKPNDDNLWGKNAVDFLKLSYELEEKREQGLFRQAGQMLVAFSVTSVALLMTVSMLLEYTNVPKRGILISTGIVLFFLLVSMILAMISQLLFERETRLPDFDFLSQIKDCECQADYDYRWFDNLSKILCEKFGSNEVRSLVLSASTASFFIAIVTLTFCVFVICVFCYV